MAVENLQDDQVVRITERMELEREIMQFLSQRFSLTYRNTSMNSLFTSQIGYLDEKEGADQILQGNIPDDLGIDEEAKEFCHC